MAPGETYPRSGGSGFGAVDRQSGNYPEEAVSKFGFECFFGDATALGQTGSIEKEQQVGRTLDAS
jgi:hypothetical protein